MAWCDVGYDQSRTPADVAAVIRSWRIPRRKDTRGKLQVPDQSSDAMAAAIERGTWGIDDAALLTYWLPCIEHLCGPIPWLRNRMDETPEQKNRRLSEALDSDFHVPMPDGLRMYSFQKAAVEFAQGKDFVILADEMGSGKSLEAIGILNCLQHPGRILVICTATLKGNWVNEIQKWSTHNYGEIAVVGTGKKKIPEAQVTVINYDLLGKRILPGPPHSVVICDEAAYISNINAARTQHALEYLKAAMLRIIITGTPINSSPYDLWPVISISGLPVAENYLDTYVTEEERSMPNSYGGEFTYVKRRGKNLKQLSEALRSTCMVRRFKKDILPQLPEKVWQIITIPAVDTLDEEVKLRVSRLLEHDDEYRQAVFSKAEEGSIDGHISTLRREGAIRKAPHVARHVSDLLDADYKQKVVLFAHHSQVVSILSEKLHKYHPVVVTGSTPAPARTAAVETFQEDQNCRIFIGSIRATAEGITLVAASVCVFAELDWSASKMDQAECRLHRIGQKSNVLIQHIVEEGSIDQMIAMAIVGKRKQAEGVA